MDTSIIEYIDHKPIFIPYLTYYKNGVTLPSKDNTIKVIATEKKHLLRMKNGANDSFIEKRTTRKKPDIISEESTEEE